MKLLIDANILLDVLQNRKPHVDESSIIWKLCETEQTKGYISALTFANLVYVMRKELEPEKIEEVLKSLSLIFEFVDLSASDLSKAAQLKWDDFEDALQSVTAERIHADFIITRNVRDFAKSKVVAFTPGEIIARI
ncbi:MAG: PIN domain-containing protein [Oscillospiraceae bacterium]|nr:PIN domain-containing protein [Oscillospiraceae bacterium]